jgi:hypothetical protein
MQQGLLSCEACGLLSRPAPGEHEGCCPRCGEELEFRRPASLQRTWAFLIAAAICYVPANLAVLLGTPQVAVAPLANFKPAYRVTIDVQRFESLPGEAVVVEAVWAVSKTASGEARSGRTVTRETVQGEDFDALAAAHSRALAKVSADIAAAIRAAADSDSSSPQTRKSKSE